MSSMRNTDFLKQNLIAHRGMHNINLGIAENSIEAFEEAVRHNYIIELDLHILKDNSVVVFHDDNLERMTGLNKDIKETTYEEIKDLELQNTKSHIPLFKEVLKIVDGKVPIIIELKYDSNIKILEEKTNDILKEYKGKYAIKSFNPYAVYLLKKKYPEIIRGQLSSNFKNDNMNLIKKFALKNMIFNFITKPDFISYDIGALPNRRVEKFRKRKTVLGWTIRNREQMEKAKKYCDNFICENIEDL